MTHRRNRPTEDTRSVYCAVVEVPAMSDPFDPRPNSFRDLVPWADPYIAALIEKLRRAAERDRHDNGLIDELPPPLGTPDGDDDPCWPGQWSPRNWPND